MACCDCRQGGPCGRCLAEEHPDGLSTSSLHLGGSVACVPNYGGQELAVAFAKAAIDDGLRRLGIDP